MFQHRRRGRTGLPAVGHWGYRSYREHLADRFPGQRIRKLCLNAGFSCPNLDGTVARGGCTFCNNVGFVPQLRQHGDLQQQWTAGRRALRQRHGRIDGFIAYFQAFSNTHGDLAVLRGIYDPLPGCFAECVGVSIATRADCLPETVLTYLESLAARLFLTVEIGLQSTDDQILSAINRGHDLAAFEGTLQRAADRGFEICVHFIVGLPGEGAKAGRRLGAYAATLPITSVKIHNLHLMRGTAMARELAPELVPNRDEHLAAVRDFIAELRPDQCVQRLIADAPDDVLVSDGWCHDKQGFLGCLGLTQARAATGGAAVAATEPRLTTS